MSRSLGRIAGFALVVCLGVTLSVHADQRPDHFEGKPAESLAEAVASFSEYNQKLADIVAKSELSAADMVEVHELTYTLENALEKIRSELDMLADVLEEVHVASERLDAEKIKSEGLKYLETAREVIR